MIQLDELKQQLKLLRPEVESFKVAVGYEENLAKISEIDKKSASSDTWSDINMYTELMKEKGRLNEKNLLYTNINNMLEDNETMLEIAMEEQIEDIIIEISQGIKKIEKDLEAASLTTLLTGEHDANNAILSFHAGAGGTEAQDWVEMLYRMYTRWAERHNFKVKVLDYLNGDEAGIKSVSILIEGNNAYGFLKSEAGVHRVVRISPFDTSGRRHTSFSSLEVMPEISDSGEIEIKPVDLRIDTYRASGAGGQHVNKTESAVRITHLPTGVVVTCQNQRSQHKNKEVAMSMLRSKLAEIKERAHLDKVEDIKGIQKEIGWGDQIRSYVFMPYTMVKDHRTDVSIGNIGAVMDGDIDVFIYEYLKAKNSNKLDK